MTELMSPGGALDERVVAQATLDAAEEQLQSLCASYAGSFVSVERRGRSMEQALQDLQKTIKEVEPKVANAQQYLEQDEDKDTSLAVLSERHRVRRRTLLQHGSLLELLELPSLMDACVRSNLYEEALSIAAFSNTLERRHKDSNVVVTRVIAQIRSRQTDLRRHLLHRLKSHVTMPECLEVVTALRRLNSIDLERQSEVDLEAIHACAELRLQVDFLEARDAWLDSTSAPVANSSSSRPALLQFGSSEQLLDAIERHRTRVFEVATQFNAIFRAQINQSKASASLLSMWTSRRVHSFLNLLTIQLGSMEDSASLRDALEASVFFASSMGRLGADFSAQLPALFEPKMRDLVVVFWKEGAAQLAETLKVCREAGAASPLVSHNAPSEPAGAGASLTPLDELQPPPRQLLALPPLARFINTVLTGLNELRRCLMPGVFTALRTAMNQVLASIQSDLVANDRAVMAPGLRGEASDLRELATRFQTVFADIVEPYVRGSLEAALGNKDGAEHFHSILRKNEREPGEEEEEAEPEEEEVDPEPEEKEKEPEPKEEQEPEPEEAAAEEVEAADEQDEAEVVNEDVEESGWAETEDVIDVEESGWAETEDAEAINEGLDEVDEEVVEEDYQ